jgi:hypothetical protein
MQQNLPAKREHEEQKQQQRQCPTTARVNAMHPRSALSQAAGVDKVAEDHRGDQKLHTGDENLTLTLLTQNRHK